MSDPTQGLIASESGTLMETLAMQVERRDAQCTIVSMPVGGASAALIETAASVAAREAAPEGKVAVGTELNVSHLRAVRSGRVRATATPLHLGRRTGAYQVHVHDDAGRLTAHGTLRVLFS